MIRPHGLIAALNATENDVGLQRARHEGVTQWLATVVTVRRPTSSSQEPGQRFDDEKNLTGLNFSFGNRMPASGRIFDKLDFGRNI
jgi:hypothetical protein